MPGSRVKKNEEIKRYYVNHTGKLIEGIRGDLCRASDITLMIEQMGAMKDQIKKLTNALEKIKKLCIDPEIEYVESNNQSYFIAEEALFQTK